MAVKSNYDYESKRLARQKIVNFAIQNYGKKERKDLSAAFFPGYDEDLRTSLELVQVYDTIGMPRDMLVGIEKDPKIYEKLKKADLGIKLYNMSDYEFFKKTNEKFDIVSLDYTGRFSDGPIDSLRLVFGREVLKDRGVLHTNFYSGREGEKAKGFLYGLELKDEISRMAEHIDEFEEPAIAIFNHESLRNDLKSIRDRNITDFIKGIAYQGRANLSALYLEGNEKYSKERFRIRNRIEEFKSKFEENMIPKSFAYFFMNKMLGSYFCEKSEKYSYVSDSGAPMLTDLFLFDRHMEWFDEKKHPIKLVMANGSPMVKINGFEISGLVNPLSTYFGMNRKMYMRDANPFVKSQVSHVMKVYASGTPKEQRERVFLGSSAAGRKKSFTEDDLYEMIERGDDDSSIMKAASISKEKLAAHKAWATMRRQRSEILSRIIPEDMVPYQGM